MTSLRRLERTLVCQRAQAVALPLAVDFVDRWELALSRGEPTPDPIDFVLAVARADIPIIRSNPVLHYMEQCEKDKRVPDVDRMVMALVHGFARIAPLLHRQTMPVPGAPPPRSRPPALNGRR